MEQLKTLLEIVLTIGLVEAIFTAVLWIIIIDTATKIVMTIRRIFTISIIVKLAAKRKPFGF